MATAHQLLSNLYDGAVVLPHTPRVTVLYAAPSMDALQLVPDLARYQAMARGGVDVRVWVEKRPGQLAATLSGADGVPTPARLEAESERGTSWAPWLRRAGGGPPARYEMHLGGECVPVHVGRVQAADVPAHDATERLVVVCGPDGFVAAMAGPKGRDLVSQGPLRGAAAERGYAAADVVKL